MDKVLNRYMSSLLLLAEMIPHTYRTYLFDNSEDNTEATLVAEISRGETFIRKTDAVPWWINEFVIKKLFS
jgi:predicted ABC-type ATPase